MTGECDLYICPFCHAALEIRERGLYCPHCENEYPILSGIPDFLPREEAVTTDLQLKRLDRLAGVYESSWWYPLVINVYLGRNATSFTNLLEMVRTAVQEGTGVLLDVACGPGTYGRRIASEACRVYAIDISMGMLKKGLEYVARDRVPNIHFSRTTAGRLPFPDGSFDAAICSGALHLFPDPLQVLCEIRRTLKPGARLAVMTFIVGDQGLLRHASVRRWAGRRNGLHVFTLPELEMDLTGAGFVDFEPQVFGSGVFFTARAAGPGK